MTLEEEGKQFGDHLLTSLAATGINSNLTSPEEAFQSGVYWGAVQGYKRGVNQMLQDIPELLPLIYNEIIESGCDMTKNWVRRFQDLVIEKKYPKDE